MPFWSRRSSAQPASRVISHQPSISVDQNRITGIGPQSAISCAHYWPGNVTDPLPTDICMFCGCRPTDSSTAADATIIKQSSAKVSAAVLGSGNWSSVDSRKKTATFKLRNVVRECALKHACTENHLLLLVATHNANKQGKGAASSLMHSAASKGDPEMVRYLVSKGVPINGRDAAGQSPLFAAAANGKQTAVHILAIAGAAVQLRPTAGKWEGKTALEVAILRGDAATTAVLATAVVMQSCTSEKHMLHNEQAARADAAWYVALASAKAQVKAGDGRSSSKSRRGDCGCGGDYIIVSSSSSSTTNPSRKQKKKKQQREQKKNTQNHQKSKGKRNGKSKGSAAATVAEVVAAESKPEFESASMYDSMWKVLGYPAKLASTDSSSSSSASSSPPSSLPPSSASATSLGAGFPNPSPPAPPTHPSPAAWDRFRVIAHSMMATTTKSGGGGGSGGGAAVATSTEATTSMEWMKKVALASVGNTCVQQQQSDSHSAHLNMLYQDVISHCEVNRDVVNIALETLDQHAAAANTIQSWWRAHSEVSKRLWQRTRAATAFQSIWRGQLVRRRYNKTLHVLRVLNMRRELTTSLVEAVMDQGNVAKAQELLEQWPAACTAATDALASGGWCTHTGVYRGVEVLAAAAAADATRVKLGNERDPAAVRNAGSSDRWYVATGAAGAAVASAPFTPEWKPAERPYRFFVKKGHARVRVHPKPSSNEVTLGVIDTSASKKHLVVQREYGSRIIINDHGKWIQLANPQNMFGGGPAWVMIDSADSMFAARHSRLGSQDTIMSNNEFFDEKRSTDYLSMSPDCVGRLDAEVINYDRSTVIQGPAFRSKLEEPSPFRQGTASDNDGSSSELDLRQKTLMPAIDLPKVLVLNPALETILLVQAATDASDMLAAAANIGKAIEGNDEVAATQLTTATAPVAATNMLDMLLASPLIDLTVPVDAVTGSTILHICAKKDYASVIKHILSDAARRDQLLHVVDNMQCTALLTAVLADAPHAVEQLLASGADPLFLQLAPPVFESVDVQEFMAFEMVCNDGPGGSQVCRPARIKHQMTTGGIMTWMILFDDYDYNRAEVRLNNNSAQPSGVGYGRPLGWAALQNPPVPMLLPASVPSALVAVGDFRGTINWDVYNRSFARKGWSDVTAKRSQKTRAVPARTLLAYTGLLAMPKISKDGIGSSSSGNDHNPLVYNAAEAAEASSSDAEHFRLLAGQGFTAATAAAWMRSERLVSALSNAGVNFDQADNTGNTPLLRALELSSADPDDVDAQAVAAEAAAATAEHLLALGCLVDVANQTGETPLIRAARWRDPRLVQLLLRAGADPTLKGMAASLPSSAAGETTEQTALSVAASNGNIENLRLLIDATKVATTAIEANGTYPKMANELMEAAKSHCPEAVTLLLEAGAKPGTHAADVVRHLCSKSSLETMFCDGKSAEELAQASITASKVADNAVAISDQMMRYAARLGTAVFAPAAVVRARDAAVERLKVALLASKQGRKFVSVSGSSGKHAGNAKTLMTPPQTPPTTDDSDSASSADETTSAYVYNGITRRFEERAEKTAKPFFLTEMPKASQKHIGMKLEADDLKTEGYICVATINEVNAEGEYLIHFDGWSENYDYWALPTSEHLHPVGFCATTGYTLQPPGSRARTSWQSLQRLGPRRSRGSSEGFDWSNYLLAEGAYALPFGSLPGNVVSLPDNVVSVSLPATAAAWQLVAAPHTISVLGVVLARSALTKDTLAMADITKMLECLVPSDNDDAGDGTDVLSKGDWQQNFPEELVKHITNAHSVTMTWENDPLEVLAKLLLVHAAEMVPSSWKQTVADYVTKDIFGNNSSLSQTAKTNKMKWGLSIVDGLINAKWSPERSTLEPETETQPKQAQAQERHAGVVFDASSSSSSSEVDTVESWFAAVTEKCILYQTGFNITPSNRSTGAMRKGAIQFLLAHSPEKCARCGICDEDFIESLPMKVSHQTKGTEHFQKAKCTHAYCQDCLKQWISTQLEQNMAHVRCPCPECPVSMYEDDITRIAGEKSGKLFAKLREADHRERLVELIKNTKLHAAVIASEAKPCPRCHVVINKFAGCNSLMCNCGHSFNWSTAVWPTIASLEAAAAAVKA